MDDRLHLVVDVVDVLLLGDEGGVLVTETRWVEELGADIGGPRRVRAWVRSLGGGDRRSRGRLAHGCYWRSRTLQSGSGGVAVPACGVGLGSRCDAICSFTARCCRGAGCVHDADRLQCARPARCALISGVCPTATATCGGDCHRSRPRASLVGATADPAADGDYRPGGHRLCGEGPCGDAGPCTGRSVVLTWCTCRRPWRCGGGDRRECPRGCVSHGTQHRRSGCDHRALCSAAPEASVDRSSCPQSMDRQPLPAS